MNTAPTAEETETPDDKVRSKQISGSQSAESDVSRDQQVAGAITDLAARIERQEDAIKVSQARSVTWGSAALGCPKKGMSYTQALVPGVLLILETDGQFYRYHGRTGSRLFFCPVDRAKEPAYGPGKEFM